VSNRNLWRDDVQIDRRKILAAGGFGALATLVNPYAAARAGAREPDGVAVASTSWSGSRKIAFFLVHTTNDSVPPDWAAQIDRRANFDPNANNADVSLRAFVRANSYGRADIDGHVIDIVSRPPGDIPVNALAATHEQSLRDQGFNAGFIVTLGGPGAGSAQPAGFWARAAFSEEVGVWAMELLHVLTGYWDLYIFRNHLDVFDTMASANGAHCSAFTKRVFGWVDDGWITRHTGRIRTYDLHALALPQPAPPGRHTAIKVGADPKYFLVEARPGADQFDNRIPSNRRGVIVYQVENPDADSRASIVMPDLPLQTLDGLRQGDVFTTTTGVEVRVTGTLATGFTVRIVDTAQHLINRSGEFGTPAGAGRPTAVVIPGLGVHNIAYRDTSGRLWELWRDSAGRTGTTNLTGNAGAPAAIGDPFAYVHHPTNTEILLYRGAGGVVHSLYWSTGAVGHDNLSGTAGAPVASGDPVGYHQSVSDTHHVIYRTSNGHLQELFWAGAAPVQYGGDLTAAAGAPNAIGNPSAYAVGGTNLVFYRGADNRIHSLYWETGAVGHDNLSGFANTPNAISEPFAYHTAFDDVNQVVYVGTDGHIYELYWQGANAVSGWDLSAPSGAPPAAGPLTAYYNAAEHIKHVIYRSPSDGRLHELYWTPGGGVPVHGDLTAFAAAPLASSAPVGFVTTDPNTQHVAYRTTSNGIYEIAW
jgi:hypothetical protein